MSNSRYHLVCEGFRHPAANKTQISLMLKQKLALDETQLADLMASRPTILARDLSETQAKQLGQKLARAGLRIQAKSARANQKISAEELRGHLRDGGLSHYFAGRYRHPEIHIDTQLSLLVLAALPILCFILLPLIGLLLVLPVLSVSVWLEQPLAAIMQTALATLFWLPLYFLAPHWPRPLPASGLKLDPETEALAFSLVDEVSHFIDAPQVVSIHLSAAPFMRVNQSFTQWLRRQVDLEIGLPYLEALTVQQFAGDLVQQLAPQSPRLYNRTWSLFLGWHRALAARLPTMAKVLEAWIQPMQEHQAERQQSMAQALVGYREGRRVQLIHQRQASLRPQWAEFEQFCQHLDTMATDWGAWILQPAPDSNLPTETPENAGQFRMTAPACWLLTHSTGYQKALRRQFPARARSETAAELWRRFRLKRSTPSPSPNRPDNADAESTFCKSAGRS